MISHNLLTHNLLCNNKDINYTHNLLTPDFSQILCPLKDSLPFQFSFPSCGEVERCWHFSSLISPGGLFIF